MKNILSFLLVTFVAFSFTIAMGVQPTGAFLGGASKNKMFDLGPDTIVTSTSLDTSTFTLGTYHTPYSYDVQISADSLTGATGCTCHLELSSALTGSDWVSIDNAVVNGVTTRDLETGTIAGGRLRVSCYAPSSTQTTAIRVAAQLSLRSPN